MVSSAARMASAARGRSGHNDLAIPQTACATMATATTLSPCTQPDWASPWYSAMPKANRISAIADGKVNPAQAASSPSQPARPNPSAIPTWLLAGPGRNWHRATRSE